jgi:hypothetical protein
MALAEISGMFMTALNTPLQRESIRAADHFQAGPATLNMADSNGSIR